VVIWTGLTGVGLAGGDGWAVAAGEDGFLVEWEGLGWMGTALGLGDGGW
jgi:hypothetical protein